MGRLIPRLLVHADASRPLDILEVNLATGLDIVGAFFFGTTSSTNFLQDEEARRAWLRDYNESHTHDRMLWIQELPGVAGWLGKLGINVVSKISLAAEQRLNDWCERCCNEADKMISVDNKEDSGSSPVVYHYLRSALDNDATLSGRQKRLEAASEILDHLGMHF